MLRLCAMILGAMLLLPYNALAGGFFDGLTQYKKGNLKFGMLEIHPSLGVEEMYDTNIYLVPPDLEGVQQGGGVVQSGIHNIRGGINLSAAVSEMHKLSLNYGINWLAYHRFSGINNAFNQNIGAAYDFKSGFGVYARVNDDYTNTDDPAFSETVFRSKRWNNKVGAMVGYSHGKFFGEVGGDTSRDHYLDGTPGGVAALQDRIGYGFGLKAGYQVMPKTKVYLGYRRHIIHYTNGNDNSFNASYSGGRSKDNGAHAFNAGVEGKILQKLRGVVETGLETRTYAANSGNASGTHLRGTVVNWMAKVGLNYKPTDRCSFEAAYTRLLAESSFGTNRAYIANKVDLNASHKFPYKLKANVGLGWAVDKHTDSVAVTPLPGAAPTQTLSKMTRRDDTYTLKMGVGYDIQEWLNAGLRYQYDQRFSIFSGQNNYKRHITGISLSASF